MAVLTTIVSSDPATLAAYRYVVESMAARILPAELHSEKYIEISESQCLLVAVLGRRDHILTHGFSMLAGVTLMENTQTPWWQANGPVPDGSFALFRTDESGVEAVTDYTGSKTIWHARLGCGGVVASTSMELIVALLGSFCVDDRALGWFLSSGTCGPRLSWDKRVRPLPPDSRLSVKRVGSTFTVQEHSIERLQHKHEPVDFARLDGELSRTLLASRFGDKPWVLALSGGYDSRAILFGTRHVQDLTCVTWVDEFLVDLQDSDLEVARQLANKAGRKHLVSVIRRPQDASVFDRALRRFVRFSDGRVDNYLAYVDGMRMWDELGSLETGGLLRGDEVFGSAVATNTARILQNMRLISFIDFAGSSEQKALAARYDHSIPADLIQRAGESTISWRSRLRAAYEIPTVYAALNSIRARFMEVSCPLLAGNLVRLAAAMPDKCLDDKTLFRQVVGKMFPDVPFASKSSILRRSDVHVIPQADELVQDHLSTSSAREVLGIRCCKKVSNQLKKQRDRRNTESDLHEAGHMKKSFAPVWVKQLKRRFDRPPQLHLPTLGMRCYLANLVREEMTSTANMGAEARNRFVQTKF